MTREKKETCASTTKLFLSCYGVMGVTEAISVHAGASIIINYREEICFVSYDRTLKLYVFVSNSFTVGGVSQFGGKRK